MFAPPRSALRALALALFLPSLASWTARAQELPAAVPSGDEEIDDPKVQRRLGARVELQSIAVVDAPAATFASPSTTASTTSGDLVLRAPAVGETGQPKRVPHMKLGYRLLSFSEVGPTGMGAGPDETFHVVSLDLYPISSKWRIGFSSQYGWENGRFRDNGDALLAESLAIGGQIPGETFVPFFEVHGGVGMMQRTHPAGVLSGAATFYGQMGLDVGTEIFLAKYAYLSFAIGYLHGTNYWLKKPEKSGLGTAQSLSGDTFTFKLGFGI
jgi:hypothetical protein